MTGRALLVAVVVALGGCGGGDEPVGVLEDFLAALEEGDNERACELLSKGEREFYEQIGSSCVRELNSVPNPEVVDEINAGDYEVEKDRSRVIVRPKSGLGGYEMVKEDGEWRVASSR